MKKKVSKVIALSAAALMLLSMAACNAPDTTNPKNGERKVIDTTKTIYYNLGYTETLNAAYYENQSDILLVDAKLAASEVLKSLVEGLSPGASLTIEETPSKLKFIRENGAYWEMDFVKDTIYCNEIEMFSCRTFSETPMDPLGLSYYGTQGQSIYLKRSETFKYAPGNAIFFNLAERNIPLDIYQGKKYMPFQTFNDLFLNPYGVNFVYNSENLFLVTNGALSPDLTDLFYLDERTERSQALTEFNYNELCLFLDMYYGLQAEHGINNGFDDYLTKTELKEVFMQRDSFSTFNGLGSLVLGHFSDFHSNIGSPSPYYGSAERDEEDVDVTISEEYQNMRVVSDEYPAKRQDILGEVLPYQVIGDTAYVTFDNFHVDATYRSLDYEACPAGVVDTFTIIMYAHEQIKSAGDAIKNVVLDLSCNGGGAVDAALFTVSWMLGSCEMALKNPVTGTQSIMTYTADVNMDGEFDEDDTISDKNLYCLVSPVSFSCGNSVPAMLKQSDKVTIVGKKSGGGSCCVRHAVTADGTTFTISEAKQMSVVQNGSLYNIDEGVEPHIPLTKMESFYDRVALTEYLKGWM